jgi:hypothetical protein
MAGIKGLSQFKSNVANTVRFAKKGYLALIRDIAVEANEHLIMATRVLSGTARHSWVAATDDSKVPDSPEILPGPRKGFSPNTRAITSQAIRRNRKFIEQWNGEETLMLASKLFYIKWMEKGKHNFKTPTNMLLHTHAATRDRLTVAMREFNTTIQSIWSR